METTTRINKLQKPGELRRVMPRVCATCRYFHHDDGLSICERDPDNRVWDTGDGDFWFVVCDKWSKIPRSGS